MCEQCKAVIEEFPPAILAVLEKLAIKAEAFGSEITKELQDCGYLKVLPETFTEEQRKAGVVERTAAIYALACIAGFTVNSVYHDPDIAVGGDNLFSLSSQYGWASSYVNESAARN